MPSHDRIRRELNELGNLAARITWPKGDRGSAHALAQAMISRAIAEQSFTFRGGIRELARDAVLAPGTSRRAAAELCRIDFVEVVEQGKARGHPTVWRLNTPVKLHKKLTRLGRLADANPRTGRLREHLRKRAEKSYGPQVLRIVAVLAGPDGSEGMTEEEIAEATGLTQQTVNGHLRKLKEGLVIASSTAWKPMGYRRRPREGKLTPRGRWFRVWSLRRPGWFWALTDPSRAAEDCNKRYATAERAERIRTGELVVEGDEDLDLPPISPAEFEALVESHIVDESPAEDAGLTDNELWALLELDDEGRAAHRT